jgi:hypothetical protein
VRHCGWWPDYVLRLWRRGRGRFVDATVHERVEVQGGIARLKEPIEHDAIADLADAREKASRYAAAAAEAMAREGKRSSRFNAMLRAAAAFLRTFVWRGGILDGKTGISVARYNATYTYLKWAHLVGRSKRRPFEP